MDEIDLTLGQSNQFVDTEQFELKNLANVWCPNPLGQ